MTDITREAITRTRRWLDTGNARIVAKNASAQLDALRTALDEAERERDQYASFIDAMADQISDDRVTIKRLYEDKAALKNEVHGLKPEVPRLSMRALEAAYSARSDAVGREARAERDAAIARAAAVERAARFALEALNTGHIPTGASDARAILRAALAKEGGELLQKTQHLPAREGGDRG